MLVTTATMTNLFASREAHMNPFLAARGAHRMAHLVTIVSGRAIWIAGQHWRIFRSSTLQNFHYLVVKVIIPLVVRLLYRANSSHHFHVPLLYFICTMVILLGDCDSNDDCVGDLICFQRNANEPVPGCIGAENDGSRTDYCVSPSSAPSQTSEPKVQWSTIFPLARCQGETPQCHLCFNPYNLHWHTIVFFF